MLSETFSRLRRKYPIPPSFMCLWRDSSSEMARVQSVLGPVCAELYVKPLLTRWLLVLGLFSWGCTCFLYVSQPGSQRRDGVLWMASVVFPSPLGSVPGTCLSDGSAGIDGCFKYILTLSLCTLLDWVICCRLRLWHIIQDFGRVLKKSIVQDLKCHKYVQIFNLRS